MDGKSDDSPTSAPTGFQRATPIGDPPPLQPYAASWLDPAPTAIGRLVSFLDTRGDAAAARVLFRTFPTLLARTLTGHGRWVIPADDIYNHPGPSNNARVPEPHGPDFVLCEKTSEGYLWIPITVLGAQDPMTDATAGVPRMLRRSAVGLQRFGSWGFIPLWGFGDPDARERALEGNKMLRFREAINTWTRHTFGPPDPGPPAQQSVGPDGKVTRWYRDAEADARWLSEHAGQFAPPHLFKHKPRDGFVLIGRRANITDIDNLIRSKVRDECGADVRSYDWLLDLVTQDALSSSSADAPQAPQITIADTAPRTLRARPITILAQTDSVTATPMEVSASPTTLSTVSAELVQLLSALRALPARAPATTKITDDHAAKATKQQAQSVYLDELKRLSDEVVERCEFLLNVVGPGICTAMRELVKRHTTTHGSEHNPFDDDLLATVIDEAIAIGGLNSIAPAPMHASVNAPGPKNEFRTSDRNQGMHQPEAYVPTNHDRQLFRDLMAVVRRDPDRFALAGAAIDTEYSTQGIRDRKAAEHRQFRRVLGDNYMSSSRAFQRRTCNYEELARQLGFRPTPEQVVAPPPMRSKGQDGRPCHPDVPLRERFDTAFRETFEDDTSLDVLPADRRHELASRRILMAWLRVDPDRASVRRITEFQELRTEPTEDGLPSLSMSDDADSSTFSKSLFVYRNGAFEHNALAWIAKARDALNALTAEPVGGLVQQFTKKLHETLDMMVVLEHEKPRGDDWAHNQKLLDLKNSCIKSLRECYTLSGGLPDALTSVWTPTVAQEIADMRTAIDTLSRRMRASTANGFNHPILRVSNAPNEWKEDWDKHERFLWHMVNRLPSLDLGSPTLPAMQGVRGTPQHPAGGGAVNAPATNATAGQLARRIGGDRRALVAALMKPLKLIDVANTSVFKGWEELMADMAALHDFDRIDGLAAKYPELAPAITELQDAIKQFKDGDEQQRSEIKQRVAQMTAGMSRVNDVMRVSTRPVDDPLFWKSIPPMSDRIKEAVKEALAELHGSGANSGVVESEVAKGQPSRKRVKLEIVEPLIRDHLNRRPHDTVAEVAAAVGCSKGLISDRQKGSKWWRANQNRLKDCKAKGTDPIGVPLDERWMNESGATKGGQMHAQKQREAAQDEVIDRRDTELFQRIDEYRKAHETASPQDVARALNCTAREVELRDAQIARLVAEQADHSIEDDHPLNPRTPKQKGRKWVTKQV